MKRFLLASFALTGFALTAAVAQAGGCGCKTGCAATCGGEASCGCGGTMCTYVDQACIRYKPEYHERQVTETVNKLTQREVTDHQTVSVQVPVWTEVTKFRTVCVQVPHECVHDVTCTRNVETCEVDPCTGCSHKVCRPETFVKQVKTCVMETVQQQQPYTEKVCTYHEETKTVDVTRMVCEFKPETVTRTENTCTMVPYATTVRVQSTMPAIPVGPPPPNSCTCASTYAAAPAIAAPCTTCGH